MKRGQFIRQCAAICAGPTLLALWMQSCAARKPIPVTWDNGSLVLPISSFAIATEGGERWKRSVTVAHEKTQFPIVIYRLKEDEYRAILLRCTHQGVELNVYGDLISCSAHGSEFNTKGEVLQGPADTALQTFPVTSDGQNLFVRLT